LRPPAAGTLPQKTRASPPKHEKRFYDSNEPTPKKGAPDGSSGCRQPEHLGRHLVGSYEFGSGDGRRGSLLDVRRGQTALGEDDERRPELLSRGLRLCPGRSAKKGDGQFGGVRRSRLILLRAWTRGPGEHESKN
jgi:hypothetical protein